MRALLSYWSDYFTPGADAPLSGHSTGQIAQHLYDLLDARLGCDYVGEQPVGGVDADLFVGHFWAFLDFCDLNRFDRRVAVYPVANPVWTRELLLRLAAELDVPMPWWDIPPRSFDHHATMATADAVLVVGNSWTLSTFPAEEQRKIHLVNYAPATAPREAPAPSTAPEPRRVCYVATHCDLRKGFMDVLDTWSGIGADEATLDVVGAIRPPWDRLLAAKVGGNVRYHGFVNSKEPAYHEIIRSCRFAYLPTYSEGQVGTLLEAIQQGCIPITTRACGIADSVLEHCVIVEPRDPEGQRRAILEAVAWPEEVFQERRARVADAAGTAHTWDRFDAAVGRMVDEVLA